MQTFIKWYLRDQKFLTHSIKGEGETKPSETPTTTSLLIYCCFKNSDDAIEAVVLAGPQSMTFADG